MGVAFKSPYTFQKEIKYMLRQFQMIRWLEITHVMAPRGQDFAYYYLMSCMVLLKKHNIKTINMWKQEDQAFPLHANWTWVTTVWCRDQDKV